MLGPLSPRTGGLRTEDPSDVEDKAPGPLIFGVGRAARCVGETPG